MTNKLLETVSSYYTIKVEEHGTSSKGVDWNSKESQYLRFEKICGILPKSDPFSILDWGCGIGELANYLTQEKFNFKLHYEEN